MAKPLQKLGWIGLPAGILAIVVLTHPNREVVISVDTGVKYQSMSGWEATVQPDAAEHSEFSSYSDELFDRAVDELGINRLRVEVRSGTENPVNYFQQHFGSSIPESVRKTKWYEIVNDNDDPDSIDPNGFQFAELDFVMDKIVLPLRKRLDARKEHLFLNFNYIDFGSSPFEHKENPEEYAEFVLAVYLHMQSRYGFVPDAWEMILEPDHASWSPEQIAQSLLMAAKRLNAAGFRPRFTAPSTASMKRAVEYFDEMMNYPAVLPHLFELSYHRYSGATARALEQISERSRRYRVKTAMLEHIGSGYADLHQDLKKAGASAWQQYTLWYPGTNDNGGKHYAIDLGTPEKPKVILGRRSAFLSQYFRFVRADAVRIHAESSDPAWDPLAFINKNGRIAVVVKANRAGRMTFQGLPPGKYSGCYTTGKQFRVSLPESLVREGRSIRAGIPDRGVLTLYQTEEQRNPALSPR